MNNWENITLYYIDNKEVEEEEVKIFYIMYTYIYIQHVKERKKWTEFCRTNSKK